METIVRSINCMHLFFANFTQDDLEWAKQFMNGHFYNKLIEHNARYKEMSFVEGTIYPEAWWRTFYHFAGHEDIQSAIVERAVERYGKQFDVSVREIARISYSNIR